MCGLLNARYYMAARPLLPNNPFVILNNSTGTAVLEYADDAATSSGGAAPDPEFPILPAINDSTAADAYVIVTLAVKLELRARALLAP